MRVLVDGESRRGRGPLSAWRVSLADTANSRELEATGNKTSPETQEYDSTDAESSVPCPDRIRLNEDQRGLAVRYMPMAHHLAQRLCAIWPAESEELESTAYLRIGGRLGIEPDQPLEAGTDEARSRQQPCRSPFELRSGPSDPQAARSAEIRWAWA
jgi:hypothetical protein